MVDIDPFWLWTGGLAAAIAIFACVQAMVLAMGRSRPRTPAERRMEARRKAMRAEASPPADDA